MASQRPGPRRPISRPIETLGVAQALDHLRDGVVMDFRKKFTEWLEAERAAGRLEIHEDLIGTIAGRASAIAGPVAREKAGTAVAEAFQIGVNKTHTDAEHEAVTAKIENVCPVCGRPRADSPP